MAGLVHRKFIAAIAVVSILVTGLGAGQAAARDRSAEQALAALLGIAVVGAIIADHRKKDRKKREAARRAEKVQPRPLPRRANRKLLPPDCLRSFDVGDRRMRLFLTRCLHRDYGSTEALPLHCERRVQTKRGIRRGYAARCMRRQGYQLARL